MLFSALLSIFLISGEINGVNFVSCLVIHGFVDSSKENRRKHFHYSCSEVFCILVLLEAAHCCLLNEPCGGVEVVSLRHC